MTAPPGQVPTGRAEPNTMRAPVLQLTASPHATSRPLGLRAVHLKDEFWVPRRATNRGVTLRVQYEECLRSGALANFDRAAGVDGTPFQGEVYADSDVFKWMEAVGWELADSDDVELRDRLDDAVDRVAAAQGPDGYLNTSFVGPRAPLRWTNLTDWHELYCGGHLIQAGVAIHRSTGDHRLLEVATRWADLVASVFGPGARRGSDGHPGVEMALVELYRETGRRRYLDLASFFLDERGHNPPHIGGGEYHLDHQPLRQQTEAVGHAVRALYVYAGATDVVLETGDEQLMATLQTLWADLHRSKTYLTGGVGARWEGEAIGAPYELPNDSAYAETCAAVAHIMWAWRMLLLTGDGQYRDAVETTLYNGALAGVSLSGTEFFYQNPLADHGHHHRQSWFGTACCPPNIARLLACLPDLIYSAGANTLWVHQLISSEATVAVAGRHVRVETASQLPWAGVTTLVLEVDRPGEFTVALPAPAWSPTTDLAINGRPITARVHRGYLRLTRTWRPGDVVTLALDTKPQHVFSDPRVIANQHRVAVVVGPLVYCLEQADHPGLDLSTLTVAAGQPWAAQERPNMLGGIRVLLGQGESTSFPDEGLYPARPPAQRDTHPVDLLAVPYFAWANRSPGAMQVWLRARLQRTKAPLENDVPGRQGNDSMTIARTAIT